MDIDQGLATVTDNLKKAIDNLAPERWPINRKSTPTWIYLNIRLLASKGDAKRRRHDRCGSPQLLRKFIDLTKKVEEWSENARCAHMHNCISDALDGGKIFWKAMRNLRLILNASDALHGFMPEELNKHFSNITISSTENPTGVLNNIAAAPLEIFCLSEVSKNNVMLALSYYKSQGKGEDGITQGVIATALPAFVPYLTSLFNSSLSQEIFPSSWQKARILAQKTRLCHHHHQIFVLLHCLTSSRKC